MQRLANYLSNLHGWLYIEQIDPRKKNTKGIEYLFSTQDMHTKNINNTNTNNNNNNNNNKNSHLPTKVLCSYFTADDN